MNRLCMSVIILLLSIPIFGCASKKNENYIDKLIFCRAVTGLGVNEKEYGGNTVLMYAAAKGLDREICLLLKQGAQTQVLNVQHASAFRQAAKNRCASSICLLLNHNPIIQVPDLAAMEKRERKYLDRHIKKVANTRRRMVTQFFLPFDMLKKIKNLVGDYVGTHVRDYKSTEQQTIAEISNVFHRPNLKSQLEELGKDLHKELC